MNVYFHFSWVWKWWINVDWIFSYLRHCQTVLQKRCTILPSHQWCSRVLNSPYHSQQLLWFFCVCDISILVGARWYLIVALICNFLVLSPGKYHGQRILVGCSHGVSKSWTRLSNFTSLQWYYVCFPVLIGYLYIFSGVMSIMILWPSLIDHFVFLLFSCTYTGSYSHDLFPLHTGEQITEWGSLSNSQLVSDFETQETPICRRQIYYNSQWTLMETNLSLLNMKPWTPWVFLAQYNLVLFFSHNYQQCSFPLKTVLIRTDHITCKSY